ncbi:MAG: antibiotic biosynthesis monooxygenase [Actinomycetota bacterium]|nr:antibiotic biosynthesis monooxygenase [Actinomycetota bacterium]MDQ2957006.1 antibiotic biosynthesis monooxygenase [Actinomycetota bacterium]
MSLRVVATITAVPGSEQLLSDGLVELAAATRTEAGCESYELYRSVVDQAVFITVEQWTDQDALDAHMQTPHMHAALAVVGDKLAAPPAIHPLEPLS